MTTKPKKEMDLIVISPAVNLTQTMREAMSIPEDTEGLSVVQVLKNQKKPDLPTLQELVGGLIERVPVYWHGHVLDGWINEEGKILDPPLEPNLLGTVLWYNHVLAAKKLPVWNDFNADPWPFVKRAWSICGSRDYIAGPMVIYSSMFKEALRHAPSGHTLQ